MDSIATRNKMLGCLYGQVIGDALGLGSEFMSKEEVMKYYPDGLKVYGQIIQDAHRRRWPKGAWTDDTDMMLCILHGFEDGKFDLHHIASNFKEWFNGEPMGIGGHTYKVLWMSDYVEHPDKCSESWWNLSRRQSAANGALMRTSVVGLAKNNVEDQAADICKLTHYDPRCVGSCVITTAIIHNLVWYGKQLSYEEIIELADKYDSRIGEWVNKAYRSECITSLALDDTSTMGYTLRTLSAALWCYWHAESFEAGLWAVVNEGGDADTNAAVSCAIMGAKLGVGSIPAHYIEQLHKAEDYRKACDKFLSHASDC